jgi:hypothetical protein
LLTGNQGEWQETTMAGSWFPGISPSRVEPAGIDISVAHPARIYDYVLGGKDNFAADRDAAQAAWRPTRIWRPRCGKTVR